MNNSEIKKRLSSVQINLSDWHYLHYYYLHRDIKDAIKQYAKGHVIDIGCGNKPYDIIFKEFVESYIGCDIEQSSLQKVDIICDATSIPLADSSFDTVFSSQTIEHLKDHQSFIKESFRLLKPGGIFIIAGPMYWPLHEEPNDFFRFTKYGFALTLEKEGFKIERIYENGGIWATSGQVLLHAIMYSQSKYFLLRALRFIYNRLIFRKLHNSFFRSLDKTDLISTNTMNYVIVASK